MRLDIVDAPEGVDGDPADTGELCRYHARRDRTNASIAPKQMSPRSPARGVTMVNDAVGFLKRDEIGLNRHRASGLCLSMIYSENRYTLFRIML
jgi:hypothetical protein